MDKSINKNNNFIIVHIVAAFLVIIGHQYTLLGLPVLSIYGHDINGLGMRILLFVSGYLVVGSFFRSKSVIEYSWKRILRIYPPFIVCLLATVIVMSFVTTSREEYFQSAIKYVLENMSFSPDYQLAGVFNDNPVSSAVNGSIWTLPIEFACYFILIPIALLYKSIKETFNDIIASIYMVIVAIFFSWLNIYKTTLFSANTLLLHNVDWSNGIQISVWFMVGVLYCLIDIKKYCRWEVGIAGLIICHFVSGYLKTILIPYIIGYVIIAFVFSEHIKLYNIIKRDICYELYLYSFPVQQMIIHLLYRKYSAQYAMLYLTFSVIIVVLVAELMHYLVAVKLTGIISLLANKICDFIRKIVSEKYKYDEKTEHFIISWDDYLVVGMLIAMMLSLLDVSRDGFYQIIVVLLFVLFTGIWQNLKCIGQFIKQFPIFTVMTVLLTVYYRYIAMTDPRSDRFAISVFAIVFAGYCISVRNNGQFDKALRKLWILLFALIIASVVHYAMNGATGAQLSFFFVSPILEGIVIMEFLLITIYYIEDYRHVFSGVALALGAVVLTGTAVCICATFSILILYFVFNRTKLMERYKNMSEKDQGGVFFLIALIGALFLIFGSFRYDYIKSVFATLVAGEGGIIRGLSKPIGDFLGVLKNPSSVASILGGSFNHLIMGNGQLSAHFNNLPFAENTFLSLFYDYGVMAFALYLGVFIYVMFILVKSKDEAERKLSLILFWLMFMSVFVAVEYWGNIVFLCYSCIGLMLGRNACRDMAYYGKPSTCVGRFAACLSEGKEVCAYLAKKFREKATDIEIVDADNIIVSSEKENTGSFAFNLKNRVIIYVGIILLPFIVFLPALISGTVISSGDGIGYEISQNFIRHVVMEGELPLWNKYVAMGTSFVGDVQQKVFYPFSWICALLPDGYSFKVFYIIHIALAGVFAFLFCKENDCDDLISLFGAAMFSFSNLIIIRFEHINIMCCWIWVPIIFTFILKYYKKRDYKYLICIVLTMALQFMAGFPQIAFYSDILVFATMLYLNYKFKLRRLDYILDAFKVGALYLIVCMVQILPLVEITSYAGRDTITYEYFSGYAAHVLQIFDMLAPKITGNYANLLEGQYEFPSDTYLGVIPLVLVIYAVLYLRKRKTIKYLLIFSGVSFIVACACNNFPLLGKIIYYTPLLGSFRTTTRILGLFVIPLMAIVVLTMREIGRSKDWSNILKIIYTLIVILVVLGIICESSSEVVNSRFIDFYAEYNIFLASTVLLIVLAIIINVLKKFESKSWCMIAMGIIIIVFQVFDVYCINIDASTVQWRMPQISNNRTYAEVFDSDLRDALVKDNVNGARYIANINTWNELYDSSWGIRANGNMMSEMPTLQAYITFNNKLLNEIANAEYPWIMDIDEYCISTNPSLVNFLNVGYITNNEIDHPFGQRENMGVAYEEYTGRTLGENELLTTLDIEQDVYFKFYIDASVAGDGSNIYAIDDAGITEYVGSVFPGEQYYEINYIPDYEKQHIDVEFDKGYNATINGIRIEKIRLLSAPAFELVYSDGVNTLYKNKDVAGHAFVVENLHRINDPKEYVVSNKNSIDFMKDGYTSQIADGDEISGGRGMVTNVLEKNNAIIADAEVESDKALIVFSETYYPGWTAYIDGHKTDIIEIDGLVQGIIVPKGKHTISFKFIPKSVIMGGAISVIGIGIIAISMWISIKKKKKAIN